tara:strand:- start:529 stop:1146 length:618 start_codon:yes stop_codon:yes gene_type:complete
MKSRLFLLIIFIISCNTNSINNPENSDEIIGIEMTIEATSFVDWEYYRFTDSTLFGPIAFYFGNTPENSLQWDIAFQRNHIRTNSGTSGIGSAGAYLDSINTWDINLFNDCCDYQIDDYTFYPDTLIDVFYNISDHTFSEGSTNPILESWAAIDTLNSYTMHISNNQFIVRDANSNNYYKLWIYDYYSSSNESGHVSIIYDKINY